MQVFYLLMRFKRSSPGNWEQKFHCSISYYLKKIQHSISSRGTSQYKALLQAYYFTKRDVPRHIQGLIAKGTLHHI